MNQEDAIMQRTRQARKATKLSQTLFAEKMGMERSSYNKYEVRSPITRDKIPLFCELTGVTEKWLLTGEGPMTPDKEDEKKDQLWKRYLEADDNLRKMINAGLGLEE